MGHITSRTTPRATTTRLTGARTTAVACAVLLLLALVLVTAAPPGNAEPASGVPGVPRGDGASLDGGHHVTCAITATGSVRCAGVNSSGQLGQGNTDNIGDNIGESTVPVDLGAGHRATALSAGDLHVCAIRDDGELRCWGSNDHGQLGQGNTDSIGDNAGESTVPVDLGAGRSAVAVAAGGSHTCAVLDDGQLRCWGYNVFGQLGQGNTVDVGDDPGETTVPVDLGVGRTAVAVSAGWLHTCAILDDGSLRCWGANKSGQLGQGNQNPIGDSPGETTVAVDLGPGRTAHAITAGQHHMCAVLDDGSLRCWGRNNSGQLAQGNTDDVGDTAGETTASVDLGGAAVLSVGAGGEHTCAVLTTHDVRCWGVNVQGQLGQGNTATIGDDPGETTVPVDLGAGRTALSVAAGYLHTCAVLDDRTARCWGGGALGALGMGNNLNWGDQVGETPGARPPIPMDGELIGRDTDGDGIRDAVDACPSDPAPGTETGCLPPPPATPTPTPTSTPTATPTPAGQAPVVTRLRTKPRRLVSGRSGVVRMRLSAAARVRVTLVSKRRVTVRGARVRLRVRLSRDLAAGARTLRVAAKPRTNRGRVALVPGRYVLRVRATNAVGRDTARVTVRVVG